jgi:hypothetical protein
MKINRTTIPAADAAETWVMNDSQRVLAGTMFSAYPKLGRAAIKTFWTTVHINSINVGLCFFANSE